MERFEEAIYKQRDEINEIMTEMFSLLKEYTKGKSPEKVLVTEEVSKPVTKYVNAISIVRMKNDKDKGCDKVIDKQIVEPINMSQKEEVEDNESDRSTNDDSTRWGKLKYMNALADQGSDVNSMPLTIYNKLTSEKPIGTNIRLSLAHHSYVYPLGAAEDVLVDVVGFVYPRGFRYPRHNER
ncbi:hypothetical protein Tco_0893717 [Tanacetum coccineum]|uniref:Uncharacterized protein n=1 Tax=Tanacetum coccineum TaxID=301880 RepID=A0ABQ5CA38_9ASTR